MKNLFTKTLLIACSLIIGLSLTPANALQESTPLTLDKRVKTFIYVENDVYVFTGHYRYQSTIVFNSDEVIQSISIGDSIGWRIHDSGNRIFLKPIEPDAMTNMTVLTDKRTYLFELHAEEAEDISDESLAFITQFVYPHGDGDSSFKEYSYQDREELPKIKDTPEKFNFNYTVTGSPIINPVKIFDDGTFTYIEFKSANAPIPAIFKVNKHGNESLINYRITGDYIVLEEVAQQFTLRYGDEVACVFNESNPLERLDITKKRKKFLGIF